MENEEKKREYIIATDSTTDMGADYYKENDVRFIGFSYTIDEEDTNANRVDLFINL